MSMARILHVSVMHIFPLIKIDNSIEIYDLKMLLIVMKIKFQNVYRQLIPVMKRAQRTERLTKYRIASC